MSEHHVVCGHCGGVNRIPAGKDPRAASCGACHRPLFGGAPVELDAGGFERQLGRSDIPLLVDFWAPWCGPCRAMAPEFAAAAAALEPGLRLAKVNTEDSPELAARLGIRSIPTLVLFHGGREVARTSGALSRAQLAAWVRGQLA